jgi:hypothetical protein
MRIRWYDPVAALGLALLAALIARPPRPIPVPSTAVEADGRSAMTGWTSRVLAGLAGTEYAPTSRPDGTWHAPNRRHNLRVRFTDAGIDIVPRDDGDAAWRWRGRWSPAGTRPVGRGTRVEYAGPGFVEWYDNRPDGLEQGFRLAERPATDPWRPAPDGPVRLAGRVETTLRLDASRPDSILYRDEAGHPVLVYRNLVVEDATGRRLPARIEATERELALVIDDRAAVYPVLVDPTFGAPLWIGDIDQAGAEFGYTVAAAGDVNDDGYDDILVGATEFDNGNTGEGAVFLYYGGPDGPSDTPAWHVEGNQTNVALGTAIAGGWDLNGDDYADIVLGAAAYSPSGAALLGGRVWIYAGAAGTPSTTAVFTKSGDAPSQGFGTSVAVGPVGQGLPPDLIVGARGVTNGESGEGRAFVFLGTYDQWPDATPDWTYEANQASAHLGDRVAFGGDVNGDGFGDVLVAAPDYDNGQVDEGRVYVFHGTASGLAAGPTRILESNQATAAMGKGLAAGGDVNGDGYGDILVGSPNFVNGQVGEGRASLYLGGASGVPATAGWNFESNVVSAMTGASVSAGDWNADGYADVIVGAPGYDNGNADIGWMLVFVTAGGLPPASTTLNTQGVEAGAALGGSVAGVGDVNGDGFGDVLVGARLTDNGQVDEGVAYLFRGSGDPPTTPVWGLPDGGAITHAIDFGDMNGDNFSDLVIGTLSHSNLQSNEGKVEVRYGARTGLAAAADLTIEANSGGAVLGTSVCVVGDMNGDGYADLVAGAPGYNVGGAAILYLGGSAGLSPTPGQSVVFNQVGAGFGAAVAGGDVNGDGLADLVVAAPTYDNGQTDEGAVYFYSGSTQAKFQPWGLLCETNQANVGTGISVAVADVNGDFLADVIVGEPRWSNGQAEEGRVRVFLGTPAGPRRDAAWTRESSVSGRRYGSWVAGLGDVNADGIGDWGACGAASPNSGEATINYGESALRAGSPDWYRDGSSAGGRIAPLGDIDGDGIDDFLLANDAAAGGGTARGTMTAFRGTADGPAVFWSVTPSVNNVNLGRAVPLHAGDVNADLFCELATTSYGLPDNAIGATEVTLWYGHGGTGLYLRPRFTIFSTGAPLAPGGLVPLGQTLRWTGRLRSPGGRGIALGGYQQIGPGFSGSSRATAPLNAPVAGQGSYYDSWSGSGSSKLGQPYGLAAWFKGMGPAWPRRKASPFPSIGPGSVAYRAGLPVSDVPDAAPPPPALVFEAVRPNPVRGSAILRFHLPEAGPIGLAVFDVGGRRVAALLEPNAAWPAGPAEFRWNARGDDGQPVAAGVYFARLAQGSRQATTRIVVVP